MVTISGRSYLAGRSRNEKLSEFFLTLLAILSLTSRRTLKMWFRIHGDIRNRKREKNVFTVSVNAAALCYKRYTGSHQTVSLNWWTNDMESIVFPLETSDHCLGKNRFRELLMRKSKKTIWSAFKVQIRRLGGARSWKILNTNANLYTRLFWKLSVLQ